MKVLQLAKFYSPTPGGMETVTYDLTQGMAAQGVDVEVLCANETATSSYEIFPAGYPVYRAGSFGMLASTSISPKFIFDLVARLKGCDLVHVHLPNPLANLALLLLRPKCKIVVHWHSDIVKQKYLLKLYGPLQDWLLKRADAIIATSPPYAASSPWLVKYRHKVHVIPLGSNIQALEVKDDQKIELIRQKYVGRRIVFSLGRLTYYKGFSSLIRAAALLPDDVVVLIGGGGELKDILQAEIDDLDVGDRVHLLGKIPAGDLAAYYHVADVYCLPSIARSEAFGVVLLEAMSQGKPIVATQISGSGVPWVNADNISGINVEPDNPSALAEGLLRVLSDSKLKERLGRQGKERYLSEFTSELMVGRTLGLYRNLLSK